MVADDGGNFHRVVVLVDAAEQVLQAVTFLGHEDDSLVRCSAVSDAPPSLLAELLHNLTERSGDFFQVHVELIRAHGLAGVEPTGLGVGEVVRLGDPRANVGEESGDLRDDAGGVRATEGQDVLALLCGERRLCQRRIAHSQEFSPAVSVVDMNPDTGLPDACNSLPRNCLDVALLSPEIPTAKVAERAMELAAAGVAGVRVHPAAVSSVVALLEQMREVSPDGRAPRIGTVAGFPAGRSHVLVKAAEARLAADSGAQDIAVVVDPSLIATGDDSGVLMEMAALREAVSAPVQLTAVVETGLHASGLIDASVLTAVIEAISRTGVDAVATASGFHTVGDGGVREVELVAGSVRPGTGVIAVVRDEENPASVQDLLGAGAHVVQVNSR